jgi:SSS family solute:Na+ symporter
MLFINVSYWCLNQFIVQRTFGARSLAEGQKGVIFAAAMKLVGVFMLVLPGVIAFNLFPDLDQPDKAYPTLIAAVLPAWLNGLFGAVLFGAILSSFNSVVHSLSTMFSVDIYKRIKPDVGDREAVRIGRIVGVILILLAIGFGPLIMFAEGGLFQAMKKLGVITMMPMSVVVFAAVFIKGIPTKAAFWTFGFGVLFQLIFGVLLEGTEWFPVHFLHIVAMNTVLMLGFMYAASRISHEQVEEVEMEPEFVAMTPWKGVVPAGIVITTLCVGIYVFLAYVGRGA